MKIVAVIAVLSSLSFSAFAGPLKPSSLTCSELNSLLEEKGSLFISYGLLGISRGTMYADERDASPCSNGELRQMNLRTSDGFCMSGYMCINRKR